jgi:hypothetical protein
MPEKGRRFGRGGIRVFNEGSTGHGLGIFIELREYPVGRFWRVGIRHTVKEKGQPLVAGVTGASRENASEAEHEPDRARGAPLPKAGRE